MKIAGIQKSSFVDYPGHVAAVFFTKGCNWRCFNCHNQALLSGSGAGSTILENEVLAWLDTRRGLLSAVVVTGGEPTLQPRLTDFLQELRARDFLVKLDTNGSRPEVLRHVLEEGLVDYVAMDLKAPMEKYPYICDVPVDQQLINESIDLIMGHGTAERIDYEFRTTVIPQLTHEDVLTMARRIRGARRYVLQQYRRPDTTGNDVRLDIPSHHTTWPVAIMDELETIVDTCLVRGFEIPARTHSISAA